MSSLLPRIHTGGARSRRNFATLVATALLGLACAGPGCAAETDEPLSPCALAAMEPLDVWLGENRNQVLVMLDANEEPTAEMGSQGGSHMLLGVRVYNPVLEDFSMELTATAMTAPASCPEPCADYRIEGVRNMVVDDPALYTINDAGEMDVLGLLIFIDTWDVDRVRTLTLEAVDQCGRTSECTKTW